jgi:nitronate monooxygenase
LAAGKPASLRLDVDGAGPGEEFWSHFDPRTLWKASPVPTLKRPQFLGIVASATLALTLAKKASGYVDGFIVEGPTAGGHNAPPRGALQLNAAGEPLYGPRDVPELDKIRALGRPFWLAGSYGRPGKLEEALGLGAAGIQVGTAFAFCEESGIDPEIKRKVIAASRRNEAHVFTDPKASPTGFPFKVAQVSGSISESAAYAARERICDLGYLRRLYRKADGSVGYRCPAEPLANFILKGGALADTVDRKCVCNGLPATVGFGQVRSDSSAELPLVTAGDDLTLLPRFLRPGEESYSAADVVNLLLHGAL